jgi:hypothetical protein
MKVSAYLASLRVNTTHKGQQEIKELLSDLPKIPDQY